MLAGAMLSAALAMTGLTTGAASAAATSIVPNVAPVTSGTISDVCSAPKQQDVASCLALRVSRGRTGFGVRDTTSTAPSGYGPGDLLSAYDLPAGGGEGATIAIVDAYDDPDAAADLAVYRKQFGLPALAPGQFRKVNQEGFPGDYPAGNPSWATEISLDLDMVSAIAPEADILLVEGNSANVSDLGAAVNEAVALGASYVSNSYGESELSADTQYAADYYDHPGVAVVASAGDGGYGVEFPAADPEVTAVGGTDLTQDSGTARGWTETAWDDTGSGCSAYEPKPSFQTDTGCSKRTVADVSAVADPYTGVAVYDSYSDGGGEYGQGWGQYGGTSVASPIITATYALGGPIAKGDYPNADPYSRTADLNDVSSGSNGTCSPSYLCTAGTGYDGPTGLGTPEGTAAFTDTSYGTLTGKVTSTSGPAVAGAQVQVTGADSVSTTTESDGSYQLRLPAGDYTVSVSGYGYAASTSSGIAVSVGATTTRSAQLKTEPEVTLSGVVTDGSGHGWPVQSSVVVDYGTGTLTAYTDPLTGKYSVRVAGDSSYQVQATPELTGYAAVDAAVTLGSKNTAHDFKVSADLLASEGSALGYTQETSGGTQTFADGTLPSGWTESAAAGSPWSFLSAASLDEATGEADIFPASGTPTDTSLYTPVVSVPAGQSPLVSFQSSVFDGLAQADVSTDGGTTWQTEWSESDGIQDGPVEFTLPSSGGARSVQLRFRYQAYDSASSTGGWWFATDVQFGAAWLTPQPGGLVEGSVTDANTRQDLDGVSVAVTGQPGSTTSAAMTGADDGFYYLFSAAGQHTVTGTLLNYGGGSSTVTVAANKATRANVAMPAGRFATSGNVSATVSKNGTATRTLTLANTGDHAATVVVDQFPGSASDDAAAVSGPVSSATEATEQAATADGSFVQQYLAIKNGDQRTTPAGTSTMSSAPAWSSLTDLPGASFEGVAGSYDGIEYAGLGADSSLNPSAALYSYDPATKAWTTEASAPVAVAEPGYGVIGDKLYVTGGVGGTWTSLSIVTETQVYDMATNTWSTAAANPYTIGGTDVALGGELYQIGGLSPTTFEDSDSVSVYDPSTNAWSELASYPAAVISASCGAIDGSLYCAGGDNESGTALTAAYQYTPGAATWQQIASLPTGLAGSAYSVADGELLLSGGTTGTGDEATLTTAGYAYDPAVNWWVPLPAAATAEFGAAGAVGFYTFGGESISAILDDTDLLSGYDQAAKVSLPWLSLSQSELTIQPGHKATITIALNAAKAGLTGSGTVTAALGFETDTPQEVAPVTVSLTVK